MRCVSRSAVGSSLAFSTAGQILRAVRATASWPSTRMRTISLASGTPEVSGMDESFAYSEGVPGAGNPRARMRSAMASSAIQSSLYCSMNITWSVWNIGPFTFQWKLWVLRYSEKLSASRRDRPSAIRCRSFSAMPMSIRGCAATLAMAISSLVVGLDTVTEAGSAGQWEISIPSIAARNPLSGAFFGANRELEALGAANHPEHGFAGGVVAGEEAVQVVHPAHGLVAKAHDEVP